MKSRSYTEGEDGGDIINLRKKLLQNILSQRRKGAEDLAKK